MENENKYVLGALEAFLHDVREGEMELHELFNIMGENELRYLLKMAKIGEDSFMSDSEWFSRMNAVTERMEKRFGGNK
jgi:hypothetical protein